MRINPSYGYRKTKLCVTNKIKLVSNKEMNFQQNILIIHLTSSAYAVEVFEHTMYQ